jgi:DNA primase large subunit
MMSLGALPQELYLQFPWLQGSSELLFSTIMPGIDYQTQPIPVIVQQILAKFPILPSRILHVVNQIITKNEEFDTPTDDWEHLALYPLLQILISMLNNHVLGNGLANLYAKHCKDTMTRSDLRTLFSDKILSTIGANIGVRCEPFPGKSINNIKYGFRTDIPSFLEVATQIPGEEWKLINRHVERGVVYLLKQDVIMLIREMVRKKTKPDFSHMDKELNAELRRIPEVENILDKIELLIEQHTQRFQTDFLTEGERVGSDLFAPCIRAILFKANQGENLAHMERLAIAFYFLNTNHSVEETVDIFRTLPDFDEKISRYQVEFATGQGGKGKKYTMFACAKLKTLHLCKAEDPNFGEELCRKGGRKKDGTYLPIKNPAGDYVFWKRVEISRGERIQQRNETSEKKNQPQGDGGAAA